MLQLSIKLIEQARRALLAGDRSEVVRLLEDFQSSKHAEVRWLLAAAIEDEDERKEHLQEVINLSESPYVELAQGILVREQQIQSEMSRQPWWQRIFVRYRRTFTAIIAIGVLAVGLWIITDVSSAGDRQRASAQATNQAVSIAATETATHLPPTLTPTAPFINAGAQIVAYPPFGSLRVLTLEYPAQRAIVNVNSLALQNPPMNSSFAAIVYEFTCGSTGTAYCEHPPEATAVLLLSNGQRVHQPDLTVMDPDIPPPSVIPTGSIVRGWMVFPVPIGQTPTAIILLANTDQSTTELEEFMVMLPSR